MVDLWYWRVNQLLGSIVAVFVFGIDDSLHRRIETSLLKTALPGRGRSTLKVRDSECCKGECRFDVAILSSDLLCMLGSAQRSFYLFVEISGMWTTLRFRYGGWAGQSQFNFRVLAIR